MEQLIENMEVHVNLSEADKEVIREAYTLKTLKRKEHLFKQGDANTIQGFVLSGTMRVYYSDAKGSEHVLQFALKNWWVGDMASFHKGEIGVLSVEALEETSVLVIDKRQFERLLEKVPQLEKLLRILVQNNLYALQRRFLATISETAESRYQNLLEKIPSIEQLVPQYQIASYLGILPESLSRLKKNLIEK